MPNFFAESLLAALRFAAIWTVFIIWDTITHLSENWSGRTLRPVCFGARRYALKRHIHSNLTFINAVWGFYCAFFKSITQQNAPEFKHG